MAKDTSLYVQKKIPTYQEYVQRRAAGETHDQILQQTIQEREAYHQSLPYAYLQGDDWSSYVQQRQARQQRREEVAGQINSYFSVHGPGTNGGSPFARFAPGAQAAARNPAGASGIMDYQELDKRAKIAQAEKQRQQQDKAKLEYEAAVAAYNQAIDRTTAATNEPMDEVWQGRMERAQAEEDAAKQRVDEAKKALDESGVKNGIVQWQGREELVKEYKRIQNRMESAIGTDNPAKIAQYQQDGKRLEEIRKHLETLDQATGNGAVDYSGSDRFGSILAAAGKGIASSLENTALTWADYMSKRATDKFLAEDADEEYDYEIPVMQTVRDSYYSPESRAKWDRLYAAADSIGDTAVADLERAKNGLGRLGKAGVDFASNLLEISFDAGVSAFTGIPGLAVMGARVFGESAGEARRNGATLEQQIGYAAASAGIEAITEKFSDGLAGIYGKGAADNISETVIRRLSKTPTGATFLRVLMGLNSEGLEEVASDLLHPFAERIYNSEVFKDGYWANIDPAETLYSYLMGGAVGAFFGSMEAVSGQSAAKNAQNDYITALYQQQGGQPGFFREVRDRAILERQAENPAAYETQNMSAEENAQEAMKALKGQQTESQRAAELREMQKAMQSEVVGELVRGWFSGEGVTLSDGEVKTLTEKAIEGDTDIQTTILGYREAYRMGENGDTWEDVVESVGKRYGLTPSQITYAWGYGRNVQTTESGTADISTEEGRTKAESRLAIFGERAQEALDLMQPRQDVGRYASALNKAAYLYAANGVDVQQMAEQARSGKAADIVGYLTPEQAALAQQIGEEQRQQVRKSVKAMSEARTAMRQQAAALTQGETVTAGTLEQVDSALADARARVQEARKVYADNMAKLDAMQRLSPKEWETETFQTAYNEAVDKASAAKEAIQQTEAEIRELAKKKAEAEGKKIIQRKKGTVSFGGGTVEGRRFEGVERDKLSRQQKKVVAMVESLADTINLDYVFFNGEAGTGGAYVQGGTVFVNVNAGLGVGGFSQTMAAASLSHELTHWLQEYAPEEYQNLKDFVISEVLKAGPQKLNELVKQQRAWEADRNLSYDAALDEVVANACQTMLLDSKAITELARQHMSTAQKIADYISEWTQKVKDAFTEVDTSQGAIYDSLRAVQGGLDRMQELWDEGIKAASANYDAEQITRAAASTEESSPVLAKNATTENAAPEGDVKNQFIGESAETADKDALALARQLDKQGVDNESIRQQTGWFKGMDGKWRYEIPGNGMEYYSAGDARFRQDHPEYSEYMGLVYKMLTGELTEAEENRVAELDGIWGREIGRLSEIVQRGNATLDMILKYDELFQAYPELRKVRVMFDELEPGVTGYYEKSRNKIVLNNELKNDDFGVKKTLAHEIQHLIQDREGFTPGSSPEYWDNQIKRGAIQTASAEEREERKRVNQEYNRIRKDNPGFFVEASQLYRDKPGEPLRSFDPVKKQRITPSPEWQEWYKRRDSLVEKWGIAAVDDFMILSDKVSRLETPQTSRSPVDLYRNTAGEIEARDAAARRNMTAEQRRNTPPDLGNEDTVFAEGSVQYMANASDSETTSIKQQIKAHEAELNSKPVVTSIRVSDMPTKDIQKQRKWVENRLKNTGYMVDRKGFGKIEFTPSQINTGLNYLDEPGEIAAFAALPAVLKRGEIIDRHEKHKGRRRGSITIAAPVEINGVRGNMAVALTETNKTHYHTHRIVMPDGFTFIFGNEKDAEPKPAGELPAKQALIAEPISSTSDDSIADSTPERKAKMQQWSEEENDRSHNAWAPTFYSKMENTVNEWTNGKGQPLGAKMAAGQVIGWLKGKGVKAEEIRWSGIVPWLEGRKTVTKNELLQVMAENRVQIQTKILSGKETKWSDYVESGGGNYREILFKIPGLEYSNPAMKTHWGMPDVIAHARIQDMTDMQDRSVLFIEEIQSDLHNEGASRGYADPEEREYFQLRRKIYSDSASEAERKSFENIEKKRFGELHARIEEARQNADNDAEWAKAFSPSLTKRLHEHGIKNATENSTFLFLAGISWAPIEIQDPYGFALANEREAADAAWDAMTDEEIDRRGQAWRNREALKDAETALNEARREKPTIPPDVPFAGSADTYHEYVMKNLLRMAAEGNYDVIAWTTADMQSARWSDDYAEGYRIEYDQEIPKFMRKYVKQWGANVEKTELYTDNGEETAWAVPVNDAMKKSVLTQGQPLFQRWDDTSGDTAAEANGREDAYTRIEAENKAVTDMVTALQKLTKKQQSTIDKLQKRLKLTKTPEVRTADANRMARQLVKEYGARVDVSGISEQLKELGDYILQTKELDENEVKSRARAIAAEIIDNAVEQVSMEDETISAIAGSNRGRKFTISPDFLGELDQDGGFDAFRKRNFGSFTLAKADSQSIDRSEYISVAQAYADLQSEYGKGYFPDVANEGEEIRNIAAAVQAAVPMEVNPFEQYRGEAVEALANQIAMDSMSGVLRPTPPTDADRAKSTRDALNRHIKKLVKENEMQQREAADLWATIETLSRSLDEAEERYEALREEAEARTMQVFAEGKARQTEIKAKSEQQLNALKKHFEEVQKRARERRNEAASVGRYRKQIEKKAAKLYEMLAKNDDKTHIPEVLKEPVGAFLETLDFSSKRKLNGGVDTQKDKAFGARLLQIQQILSRQQDYINGGEMQQDLGGYIDVSDDNMQYLRNTAEKITTELSQGRDFTINKMNASDLRDLSNFLSNLTSAIRKMNEFMANARFQSVREAASQDIEHVNGLGKAGEFETGKLMSAAAWESGTPYYVFRRFGEGGKAIFDSLTRGWEKMAVNMKELLDFTKSTYTDKEVNDWQKQIHDIELEDGRHVTLTTGQIMTFSMLLGREQAIKHMEKGGVRIGDIKTKKGVRQDITHYHLTEKDIESITGKLTARQLEVAQKLQRFMARRGSEWGNEISMRRFGYNFYTEGDSYFPIKTDSTDRPMSDTDAQQNSMFRLLNLSASKSLNPKASNALVVNDIFDVFTDHMSDMAKLNGMGLPILDAIKWFNFKERVDLSDGQYDTRTMQGALQQAFGDKSLNYFRTFIKDINGVTENGDRGTGLTSKLLRNYKAAAVAANLRVAFLQPVSYVRASYLIKPKYLLAAFTNKNAYKEALANSGTAVWKSMGFYDTNVARGMRDQIKHNETWKDKLIEKSMRLAEFGDNRTWGRLWVACKLQAQAETGKTGVDLIQETGELFRQTIYASQVMDSTLSRSELMRGNTMRSRAMTAFMAEPTLSYNMVMDAAYEANMNVRRYGRDEGLKRSAGYIGKALAVYACSATFSAIVESIADAFRDDDDYETFLQKWAQAMFGEGNIFSGNLAQDLTIIGKLPYFKEFMSTLQGYQSGDMTLAAFNNAINAFKIWKETIDLQRGVLEKPTNLTYYGNMTTWGKIYKTLQALSQFTGLPVANLTRDVLAFWNTVADGMLQKPEWKIRTYDPGPKKAIQTAVEKGYMSTEEAERELLEKGLVKDADDAYWTARSFEGEDKYTQIKAAALNGENGVFRHEMEQLTGHGVSEKDARSEVKSFVKKAYTGGELTKAESKLLGDRTLTAEAAKDILVNYAGMGENDAYLTVKGWESGDSGKYTGALRAAFNGDQSAFKRELADLTSHGVKQKDVESQVKSFARNLYFGNEISEEQQEFAGGKSLTDAEARKMLAYYGGLSVDKANETVAGWKEERAFIAKHGAEYADYDLSTAQAMYYYGDSVRARIPLSTYAKQVEDYGLDDVKSYYGKWQKTGLSIEQYQTYKTGAATCKGTDNDHDGKTDSGSKKAQMLQMINRLPVSSAVKDAIYRENGWAESGLYSAPWH